MPLSASQLPTLSPQLPSQSAVAKDVAERVRKVQERLCTMGHTRRVKGEETGLRWFDSEIPKEYNAFRSMPPFPATQRVRACGLLIICGWAGGHRLGNQTNGRRNPTREKAKGR